MAADSQRLKELFLTASEIPSRAERAAFLEQECGPDLELCQRLEALLRAHDASGDFLSPPGAGDSAPKGEGEEVGTVIGVYKLLQKLGEGGMGTVWVAEQHQPVKRRVALKLIKPGMDSAQVVRRFEAERQALALMDHTNIAKVFDAGTTSAGRPYFVMELVHGVPITKYCDELNLSLRERLALFVPVCQAIQHAHQKGIIHRDIKPSNVLVCMQDGRPVPKVIDFGVAKAMSQRLTESSLYTDFGAVIGTLEYMSPEQAEMSPLGVDTRADVYTLGVLLYELLTGTTPLDRKRLKKAALEEILRLIREEEPPRPSTRLNESKESLASVAAQRRTEPARLTREVRGELDWIVLKCLEKDRTRRYETASGLAKEIEHYLADEPVEACPPSAGYRLRKFARRHKGPVAAAALVLLALGAGTIAVTWGLIRAREAAARAHQAWEEALDQRRLAEERQQAAEHNAQQAVEQKRIADREKAVAAAVRTFLEQDLLRQADPTEQANALRQAGGGFEAKQNPTIRELLDRTAAALAPGKVEAKFAKQPEVQASILRAVGNTYRGVGEYGKAVEFLTRSSEIYRQTLGADHPDTLTTGNDLALAYLSAGRTAEAITLFERVWNARVQKLGADHPDSLATLNGLAGAYQKAGRTANVIPLFEKARDACVAKLGPGHPNTLTTLANLATAYQKAGRAAEAITLFEQVHAAFVKKLGPDHPHTLTNLDHLAGAYRLAGRTAEAITLFEQVGDAKVKQLGADHPDTLTTLNNLALAYQTAGRTAEAIALFERVRDARVRKLGADHPSTLATLNGLAEAYQSAGRTAEAITLFERVRDVCVKTLGPDHPGTLANLGNLAGAYQAVGKTAEALALYEQVRDKKVKTLGADHPETLTTLNDLAVAYLRAGKTAEAITLLERVRAASVRKLGADHPHTLITLANLARAYQDAGKPEQALPLLQQAATDIEKRQFHRSADGRIVASLIACHERLKQFEAAEAWRRKWLAVVKDRAGPESTAYAAAMHGLGQNLLLQQKHAAAEEALRACLVIRAKSQPDAWTTFNTKSLLGEALLGQKKYADAEPLLKDGFMGMKQREAKIPRPAKVQLTEALERLVRLYEATGNKDQAAQWRKQMEAVKATTSPPRQP